MNKRIELLAPAGGMEHLTAAVQNGADAVYLGGKLYNARINAGNFSDDEMERAIDYAHIRNVNIYVTMNILLKEEELGEAVEYAKKLYKIGADAVIVQDLGLAYRLAREVPDLPVHGSTQMTIYNEEGIEAVKKLGLKRVVLARELNLQEISNCCKQGVDIEVFGHGALCFCYSGQCNLSRANGGRSGNRGLCAQSCRLPYTSGKGERKYWLSPKDLCSLEELPALKKAGIASLKIEGRMKNPEYVAIVTSIYRKYIDLCERDISAYAVHSEDRRILEQVFNRGGFSAGYLSGNVGDEIMSFDLPKHQGVHIGKTLRRIDGNLVEIELKRGETVEMGDGVEIRNDELPGNVVTYIKHSGKADGKVIIGDIKGEIAKGDEIYKITDKSLLERARSTYKANVEGRTPELKKIPVAVKVLLKKNEPAEASICEIKENPAETDGFKSCENGWLKITFDDILPEEAHTRGISKERISEQMAKTGDYPVSVKKCKIEIEIEDNITVPVSAINRMRRDLIEAFLESKKSAKKNEKIIVSSAEKKACIAAETEKTTTDYNYTDEPLHTEDKDRSIGLGKENEEEKGKRKDKTVYLHLYSAKTLSDEISTIKTYINSRILQDGKAVRKLIIKVPLTEYEEALQMWENAMGEGKEDSSRCTEIFPYIDNITRRGEDAFLRENLNTIKRKIKDKKLFVGNLGWAVKLQQEGFNVVCDYGVNIANKSAEIAMEEIYHINKIQSAMEFSGEYAGRIPLMSTAQDICARELEDDLHRKITIIDAPKAGKHFLVREKASLKECLEEGELSTEESKTMTIFF